MVEPFRYLSLTSLSPGAHPVGLDARYRQYLYRLIRSQVRDALEDLLEEHRVTPSVQPSIPPCSLGELPCP